MKGLTTGNVLCTYWDHSHRISFDNSLGILSYSLTCTLQNHTTVPFTTISELSWNWKNVGTRAAASIPCNCSLYKKGKWPTSGQSECFIPADHFQTKRKREKKGHCIQHFLSTRSKLHIHIISLEAISALNQCVLIEVSIWQDTKTVYNTYLFLVNCSFCYYIFIDLIHFQIKLWTGEKLNAFISGLKSGQDINTSKS